MTAAHYDARTGSLTASPAALTALVEAGDAELAAAGAWTGGRAHRGLAPALDAVRHPVGGTLRVTYRGHSLDGWVGATRTAVLTPMLADGRRTLVRVHPTLLPGMLAKVVALAPRPPAAGPRPVRELARDPALVRWWTLAHGPAPGRDGAVVEVADTDAGIYTVDGDGIARPVDPSRVFRLIVDVVTGRGGPRLRPLPRGADLPVPWA